MKKDTHPQSYLTAKVSCNSCKANFTVLSTDEEFTIEVCSACHPFYTGTQRIMDTAGRADRFNSRMAKAEEIQKTAPKKKAKKVAEPVVAEEKKAEVAQEPASEPVAVAADDLTKVEGVGPKIAETLAAAGVSTFAELAATSVEKISEIIADVAGSHDGATWPAQAQMAADGKWDELKTWQDELDGGKEA